MKAMCIALNAARAPEVQTASAVLAARAYGNLKNSVWGFQVLLKRQSL
jgi:hypothetical protein